MKFSSAFLIVSSPALAAAFAPTGETVVCCCNELQICNEDRSAARVFGLALQLKEVKYAFLREGEATLILAANFLRESIGTDAELATPQPTEATSLQESEDRTAPRGWRRQ